MRIIERSKDVAIKLWKDESGASLLEYSVLIGLITVAAIAIDRHDRHVGVGLSGHDLNTYCRSSATRWRPSGTRP